MIQGICAFCKKEFPKKVYKNIYCSTICSNRYNRNGIKKVSLPEENTDLAEFIGICLGDGYTTKYQVGITLNTIADKEYISYVISLSGKLFPGVVPRIVRKKNENAVEIRINSRIVTGFLRKNGVVSNAKYVPSWILKDRNSSYACVRGLFDTEGSISYKKYRSQKGVRIYKQLNFRNANITLMGFVRDTLKILGLKPTMTLKRSLYLSNNNDIDLYREVIGFSNSKLMKRSHIYTIEEYNYYIESCGLLDTYTPNQLQ